MENSLNWKTNRAHLFIGLIAICLAIANCWIILRNPMNNDVAWYLYLARELTDGKRLYVDFVETNPPLICYLCVIPVWIAKVLHMDAKLVWTVMVTALCVGFSAASARFWGRARNAQRGPVAAIFLFLLVITLAFFFAYDFGQRDHLGFVASLGVCGLIAARVSSGDVGREARATVKVPAAIFTAVIGGLLMALKPFFLLPWVLCIGWALIRCGWRRVARWPETYIVPAMSLAQPALIFFVTPAYLEVARLVASLYSSYNAASWRTLLTGRFLLISLVGGLLTFLYPASPEGRNGVRLAGLTTLGWFLSGLLQRKGWHYHALPAVGALSFAGWMILLDVGRIRRDSTLRWQTAVRAATVLLVLVAGVRTIRLHWPYPDGNDSIIPIVERAGRGVRIAALGTGMTVFPLVNDTGARLGVHYNSLWPLPGLYAQQIRQGTADGVWHFRRPDQMGAPEKQMFTSVAADIAAEPPFLITCRSDREQGMESLKVDLLAYFAQDPRAGAALQHYEAVPVQSNVLLFRHVAEKSSLRH